MLQRCGVLWGAGCCGLQASWRQCDQHDSGTSTDLCGRRHVGLPYVRTYQSLSHRVPFLQNKRKGNVTWLACATSSPLLHCSCSRWVHRRAMFACTSHRLTLHSQTRSRGVRTQATGDVSQRVQIQLFPCTPARNHHGSSRNGSARTYYSRIAVFTCQSPGQSRTHAQICL